MCALGDGAEVLFGRRLTRGLMLVAALAGGRGPGRRLSRRVSAGRWRALKGLDARYPTAHFLRATMLAGAGRKAPARKAYRRYLALEPDGPHAAKAREHLERLE